MLHKKIDNRFCLVCIGCLLVFVLSSVSGDLSNWKHIRSFIYCFFARVKKRPLVIEKVSYFQNLIVYDWFLIYPRDFARHVEVSTKLGVTFCKYSSFSISTI